MKGIAAFMMKGTVAFIMKGTVTFIMKGNIITVYILLRVVVSFTFIHVGLFIGPML